VVLELGAGFSSLVLARVLLQADDGGQLVAIESDGEFAEMMSDELAASGLAGVATVVTAPMRRDHTGVRWYEREVVTLALDDRRPDVLMIDGPPGPSSADARRPALIELASRVESHATILIDDVDRPDERSQLDEWAAALPQHSFHVVDGHYAVGRPSGMWSTHP
jgi:predicted O-methyltransferase YrrM